MGSLGISWTTNSTGDNYISVFHLFCRGSNKTKFLNEGIGFFGNSDEGGMGYGREGENIAGGESPGAGAPSIDHTAVNQAARIAQAAMQR